MINESVPQKLPQNIFLELKQLVRENLYLKAYQLVVPHFPVQQWKNPETLLQGARLLQHLGASRLATSLYLRAPRRHPENIACHTKAIRSIWSLQGPWKAWEYANEFIPMQHATPQEVLYLLMEKTDLASAYKDFSTAKHYLDEARQLAATNRENAVIRAHEATVLERMDQPEAAYEKYCESSHLSPHYSYPIQNQARLLLAQRKTEEALHLLRDYSSRKENRFVIAQLIQLEIDLELYQCAFENFQKYKDYSILADKETLENLSEIECTLQYHRGNHQKAIECGSNSKHEYFKILISNLKKAPSNPKRNILPVPFVRQDNVTCVPATLTAIADYWQHPIDHDQLAKDITYDGTPDSAERKWLEDRGWFVKEFALDWETSVQLIDRGIPFALTTRDLYSAHMQGIIGYDEAQEIYYIREPGRPFKVEALAKQFIKRYQSNGLRAIIMLPKGKETLLDGLSLPDNELYDELYHFNLHLLEHKRPEARQCLNRMHETKPDNILTLYAQLRLARYDENSLARMQAIDCILEQFPEDPFYLYEKALCLSAVENSKSVVTFLEKIIDEHDPKKLPHHFPLLLTEQIYCDQRQKQKTEQLMRETFKRTYYDSRLYWQFSNFLKFYNQYKSATLASRFASTLSPYDEYYADNYHLTSQLSNHDNKAIQYLTERFQKYKAKSGMPAITLSDAFERSGEQVKALEILDEAIAIRPQDGDLILSASFRLHRKGHRERAFQLLDNAKASTRQHQWLRYKAQLETAEGNFETAKTCWQAILEQDPLSLSAIQELAILETHVQGKQASIHFLKKHLEKHPNHYSVWQEYLYQIRVEQPEIEYSELDKAESIFGEDTWFQRERALCAYKLRDFEAAHEHLNAVIKVEPNYPLNHRIQGDIFLAQNRLPEAAKAYRQTLALDIDSSDAIQGLLESCVTKKDVHESFTYIREELEEQVHFGNAIAATNRVACRCLTLTERETFLKKLVQDCSNLWQSWDSLITHFYNSNQLDQALDYVLQAFEKFPYQGEISYQASRIYEKLTHLKKSLTFLELTVTRNPGYDFAVRELAEQYKRWQRGRESIALLEELIRKKPFDSINFGCIADLYWTEGRKEDAIESFKRALELNPYYDWAQDRFMNIMRYLGRFAEVITFVQSLIRQKPDVSENYEFLIEAHIRNNDYETALDACHQAIERFPHNGNLLNAKARALCLLKRFDEAIEVTHIKNLKFNDQQILLIRRGYIEKQRGNIQEAIRDFEQHTQTDPNDFRIWKLLVELYDECENHDACLRAAQELIRINPLNDEGYFYASRALNNQNRRAEAREIARQGLLTQIDSESNILALLQACETYEDSVDALSFIKEQIIQQVNYGDAIMEYAHRAPRVLNEKERLALLREIHQQRPDLWQSWAAYAIELSQQRQYEDSQSLITQATQKFDHIARVHQVASEIASHSGHKEDEVAHLRRAIEVNPHYYFAIRELADRLMQQGNSEEAIQLLEKLVQEQPDQHVNYGCLADAFIKIGKQEDALENLKKAVTLDPDYRWAINEMVQICSSLNRYDELIEFAVSECKEKPQNPVPAYNLARIFGLQRFWGDAFTAIENALKLKPDYVDAIDYRAYLLCGLGRHDEAAASCQVEGLNFAQTTQLKMRRGLIENERGNFQKAADYFKEYLQSDPQNEVAWNNLVNCYDHIEGHSQEYIDAALGFVRCDPHNYVSYGHLGCAYERAKKENEAKAAYEQSYRIAPDYFYGVSRFFKACLKENNYNQCEEIIATTSKIPNSSDYAYYRLLLQVHKRNTEAAIDAFRELVSFLNSDHINDAYNALEDLLSTKRLTKESYQMALKSTVHQMVGSYWANQTLKGSIVSWGIRSINRLPYNEHSTQKAHTQFLEHFGENNRPSSLKTLIKKHRKFYRTNEELYGTVTYALTRVAQNKQVLEWCHDWNKRNDLKPWFVQNIIYSATCCNEFEMVDALLQATYQLPPDHTYDRFIVYVCLFEKSREKLKIFMHQLNNIQEKNMSTTHTFYRQLITIRFNALGLSNDSLPTQPSIKSARAAIRSLYFKRLFSDTGFFFQKEMFNAARHLQRELKTLEQSLSDR